MTPADQALEALDVALQKRQHPPQSQKTRRPRRQSQA
jgi:hypothetical protein